MSCLFLIRVSTFSMLRVAISMCKEKFHVSYALCFGGKTWRPRLQTSGGLGSLQLGLQQCIIECGPLQEVQRTPSNTVWDGRGRGGGERGLGNQGCVLSGVLLHDKLVWHQWKRIERRRNGGVTERKRKKLVGKNLENTVASKESNTVCIC